MVRGDSRYLLSSAQVGINDTMCFIAAENARSNMFLILLVENLERPSRSEKIWTSLYSSKILFRPPVSTVLEPHSIIVRAGGQQLAVGRDGL